MNEELFNYIKKQGVTPTKIEGEIKNWPLEKCFKFVNECNEIILHEKIPSPTQFSFIASNSFSGGVSDCSMPQCRVNKIDSLARFSAFYSDNILIQNPFDKYHELKKFQGDLRNFLLGDLEVLFRIEPLIKKGIIGISKGEMELCSECLKKTLQKEKEVIAKIQKGEKVLLEKYLDKINLRFQKIFGEILIYLSGPEELIEHSQQISIMGKKNPLLKHYIKSTATDFKIKNKTIKKKFLLQYLSPKFGDMLLQDIYSSMKGYNSVTDQKTDLFVRGNIETSVKNFKISRLMKNLTHKVPNLENISIKNLVKLRTQEEESFKVYRNALTDVIKKINKDTNEEEVKLLVQSEIIPEIDTLNMLLKKIREKASQSFMKKAVLGSAFISLGLFSGFVPTNMREILTSLGSCKVIEGVSNDLVKRFEIPLEIKKSKYYFLWKAQR